MRRPLVSSIVFAAFAAATASSASAAQQYFVGKGEAYGMKVSFRVVNGEVKHGLVVSKLPNKAEVGPDSITTFSAFRATSIDSKQRFKCRVMREGRDLTHPDYRFRFLGNLAGDRATGWTSTKTSNRILKVDSGPVPWTAEPVSKREYEDAAAFGDALAESQKRPGCG